MSAFTSSARRSAVAAVAGALALAMTRAGPPLQAAPSLEGVERAASAPPGAAPDGAAAPTTPRGPTAAAGPTRVSMRNVAFHVADGVVLRVRRLEGTMHGTRDDVVDLDDKTSYVTDVASAEVALTGADLTNLMNHFVFAYPGAPLRRLHVTVRDGLVHQSGTLHKEVDIPFEMDAEATATPDGRIRLHPRRMKILGVNGMALMRAFHLSLDKMLDLSKAKGVTVKGGDLYLDPVAVLPPPAIRARLLGVRVVGEELVQELGPAEGTRGELPPLALPDSAAANYMYYRGGLLHFGKLLMRDADMLVVDQDPHDAFDFDNDRYQRQLTAGYSRTLPSLGLEVFMPDASKIGATGAIARR